MFHVSQDEQSLRWSGLQRTTGELVQTVEHKLVGDQRQTAVTVHGGHHVFVKRQMSKREWIVGLLDANTGKMVWSRPGHGGRKQHGQPAAAWLVDDLVWVIGENHRFLDAYQVADGKQLYRQEVFVVF